MLWVTVERAVKTAGLTSAAVSLAIEVFDGYSLEYGFSKEDLIMNLLGIGTASWLELHEDWDQVIDFRFRYKRSQPAKEFGENDAISDYSGQTYLLALKMLEYIA